MRVYKLEDFAKRATKATIGDESLCEAAERAEKGQIDGQIGKFLIKQRITRANQDRSKGFRAIIVHKIGSMAVFLHMFPKHRQANLTEKEQQTFRLAAKKIAELSEKQIEALVELGRWIEVNCERHKEELSQ